MLAPGTCRPWAQRSVSCLTSVRPTTLFRMSRHRAERSGVIVVAAAGPADDANVAGRNEKEHQQQIAGR